MDIKQLKVVYGLIPGPILGYGHIIKTLESLMDLIKAGFQGEIKLIHDRLINQQKFDRDKIQEILHIEHVRIRFHDVFTKMKKIETQHAGELFDYDLLDTNEILIVSGITTHYMIGAPTLYEEHHFSFKITKPLWHLDIVDDLKSRLIDIPLMYFWENNGLFGFESIIHTYAHMTLVSSQSIPRLAAHAPIEPDSQIEKIIMTNSKLWRKSYLGSLFIMIYNFDLPINI